MARDIKLKEIHKKSFFSRKRSTSNGLATGAINLVRGENGGFMNMGRPNERLDLAELLKKYDTLASDRDQYSIEKR